MRRIARLIAPAALCVCGLALMLSLLAASALAAPAGMAQAGPTAPDPGKCVLSAVTVTASGGVRLHDAGPVAQLTRTLWYTNPAAGDVLLQVGLDNVVDGCRVAYGAGFGQTNTVTLSYDATRNYDYAVSTSDRNTVLVTRSYSNTGPETGNAELSFVRDGLAPTSTLALAAGQAASPTLASPIKLAWHVADNSGGAGVAELKVFYRIGDTGSWTADPRPQSALAAAGNFVFTPPRYGVTYALKSIASDYLGNTETKSQETPAVKVTVPRTKVYIPLIRLDLPPVPAGSLKINDGAPSTSTASVTLRTPAQVVGDYVAWMRLNNETPPTSQGWVGYANPKAWTLLDTTPSGLRRVYVQYMGHLSGISPVYDASIYLFWNGGFEQELARWLPASGLLGFRLAQPPGDPAPHSGSKAFLLGNPAWPDQNGVPMADAQIGQYVQVPNYGSPQLHFWYRVLSHDQVWGGTPGEYFDTFEAYVNADPATAIAPDPSDPRRKTLCRDHLNAKQPPAQNTAGLVFCAGAASNPARNYDSGWQEAVIDLSSFAAGGGPVQVYLATYNRADQYYNTYAYLDDVTIMPAGGAW